MTTFVDFLWNNKGDKIKRNVITQNYGNGELGTIDIASFNKALTSVLTRKYLDERNKGKWRPNYLNGRTQRYSVNGKLSTARILSCGVPQGSILGPLLFLIYINDLPNSLQNAVPRMFADETNLTLSAKT